MSYTTYLASRYLFGKHRIPFIAFITRTTVIGMALGVMTLLLALAVMHGEHSVELLNSIPVNLFNGIGYLEMDVFPLF